MRAGASGRAVTAIAVVAGCALLAGRGSGAAGRRVASGSAGSPRSVGAGISRCGRPVRLGAGVAVAGWRLGAIRFLSPAAGVALTAPRIPCKVPLGPGRGEEVRFQAQPVRLAVSRDGGRRWVSRGGVIAATAQSPVGEQVVAASVREVWAVSDRGKLLATRNGGAIWTVQRLPAPVVDLADVGGSLWALACPRVTGLACRPVLERMVLPAGRWRPVPVPRLLSGPDLQLASKRPHAVDSLRPPRDRVVAPRSRAPAALRLSVL
jgi:hypothetical protein